jgi:hypothetical protein
MNLRHFLFVCFAGFLLLTGGCSSFYGPHGLGQLVLLVWKVTPAQTADAQQRANRYFTKVAHHQKPRPWGPYVALQTLDPTPEQKQKYLKSRATAQEKAASEGKPLGSEWVEPLAVALYNGLRRGNEGVGRSKLLCGGNASENWGRKYLRNRPC